MNHLLLDQMADWMQHGIVRQRVHRKVLSAVFCILVLFLIGFIDYQADYRISFTSFYVLPLGFSAFYVNRVFAIILAILSIGIWMVGDIMDGAPYPGFGIMCWNAGIVFSLFLIVIYLLDALRRVLIGLEDTVISRTNFLRSEILERKKLQFEILDLTERERQRFGHEIHDVVCQELAGIAIACHLLSKKLQSKKIEEESRSVEIAQMVEKALTKARSVARGFFTANFDITGLAESLREVARNVEERSGVKCRVNWQDNLEIAQEEVVVHLFRIAQEAIFNATKHAEATLVDVNLTKSQNHILLTIDDNGKGISETAISKVGLGLRIMAYRAETIGAEFGLKKNFKGGTQVYCRIPLERTV